jgi:Protein of unknown function (DUF1552)
MASRRFFLPRRSFLRGVMVGGVSIAVPLPRLGGMLNEHGTAYADGLAMPVRFGSWFFGNGIIPDRWVPRLTGAGDEWQLSEQLAPLTAVKSHLSVVTGFAVKIPDTAPHASMPCAALTGANTDGNFVKVPTIDQLIAPAISDGVAYPNGIHVGVSNVSGATSLGLAVSFRGPNAANPPNFDPAKLFSELLGFTNQGTGGMPKPVDPELFNRSAVLDAVAEDANLLRARLGMDDQKRLDQHLEGLHQLQGQIAKQSKPVATGPAPDPDKLYPNRGAVGTISRARGQAFADLLVFAMASDLTRVFSYMFTAPACHGNYADCGLAPSSFHEDYGHRTSKDGVSKATLGFNTGVKFAMSNLADLLTRMKDTPDGAGNLLDNSAIYTTSCVSESQTHSGIDFPILVAGKAGGKLKGDQHIRQLAENVSKVPFTLLTALGGTAASFGQAEGKVTSGVAELLA